VREIGVIAVALLVPRILIILDAAKFLFGLRDSCRLRSTRFVGRARTEGVLAEFGVPNVAKLRRRVGTEVGTDDLGLLPRAAAIGRDFDVLDAFFTRPRDARELAPRRRKRGIVRRGDDE